MQKESKDYQCQFQTISFNSGRVPTLKINVNFLYLDKGIIFHMLTWGKEHYLFKHIIDIYIIIFGI